MPTRRFRTSRLARFGDFELDARSGELLRAGVSVAHRLQPAEGMGNPRPRKLTADLSRPLHLQRQDTKLDVRLDPTRRPVKHRPHLQTRLLHSPEAGFDDPPAFVAKRDVLG